MKIFVTGAKGMLGTDLVAELTTRQHSVISFGHAELEITDRAAVRRAVEEVQPAVIVNCAAYTNVDGAETDYQRALAVNALGVKNLALACRESGAAMLHVSTDYVFDGLKTKPWGIFDGRNPINAYGRTKYLGERFLEEAGIPYYLVRTAWLFGSNGPNFVATMLRLGQSGEPLKVVSDQRGCPTYTVDLARVLADLIETGAYGSYHMTNQGVTTWFDFARAIFGIADLAVDLTPITSVEYKRLASRPTNSVLDPFPLVETLGYLLPPWEDALRRFLTHIGILA